MRIPRPLVAAALSALCMGAWAAPPADPAATPRIDAREARQQARIEQGEATGALTPREAARLEAGQQRIGRAEDRAKADGTVTRPERRRLTHAQNKASRHVYRQKHDRRHVAP